MARPAWPAPMTTPWSSSWAIRAGRRPARRAPGRVGHDVEDGRALLGLGHDRLEILPGGVGVDREPDRHPVEAVADTGVGAQHPREVHLTLDGRGTDRSWMPRLGDRGDAGGQAAARLTSTTRRAWRRCPPRRTLRVVGVEDVRGAMLLLAAEAPEAFHGRRLGCRSRHSEIARHLNWAASGAAATHRGLRAAPRR